jgi:hypothetical protein
MFLSDLEGLFSKIANAGISDQEAEILIENGVLQAADEIRKYARLVRQTELDLMEYRRGRDAEQEKIAKGNRLAHERDKVESKKRTAELMAAESINGPQRGSAW